MESSAGNEREIIGRGHHRWRGLPATRAAGTVANPRPVGPGEEDGPRIAASARPPKAAGVPSGSPAPGSAEGYRRAATVRVLVAVEDRHRVYREAIGHFFSTRRLGYEVRLVKPRELYAELRRFGPQVVLHAGPPTPIPDLLPCWVELSLDPTRPTVLLTGRVRREVLNPALSDLLAMIEEVAPVCS